MLPKLPVEHCQLEMNRPTRFAVSVDRDLLQTTERRLLLSRFPEELADVADDDSSHGVKISRVRELADHWRNQYNWEDQERKLNGTFDHYLVKINVPEYGLLTLQYTQTESPRPGAIPLLFLHGWPGSFVEASKIVGPLSRGDPDDDSKAVFHVVTPSIPGFGLSPAPFRSGVGPEVVARAFRILMTDVLGYPTFATHGGGHLGASIARWIAIQSPGAVKAQHFASFPAPPPTMRSAPLARLRMRCSRVLYSKCERNMLRNRRLFEAERSTHVELQRRSPQTLGVALGDSPVGLLAWFVEQMDTWGDAPGSLDNDEIIDMVMMHWVQGATPGLRFFKEAFGAGREAERAFEQYVQVPTGVSVFRNEVLPCPKDWARQVANVRFWSQHDEGGQFPALECPETFVEDLRDFLSPKKPTHLSKKAEKS
ncbi:epoxide hydrolase [Colletotrichum sojae]|uniref:Epoxide hydrolase n=1 Tax=Colletotrichum sojae TaxID=2175907 RepID=A0A8H6J026_9PEZI|nr:epoxide hydrolase [Colletotrichum sojae]